MGVNFIQQDKNLVTSLYVCMHTVDCVPSVVNTPAVSSVPAAVLCLDATGMSCMSAVAGIYSFFLTRPLLATC
jgi:hypothetical protein